MRYVAVFFNKGDRGPRYSALSITLMDHDPRFAILNGFFPAGHNLVLTLEQCEELAAALAGKIDEMLQRPAPAAVIRLETQEQRDLLQEALLTQPSQRIFDLLDLGKADTAPPGPWASDTLEPL